MRRYFWDFFGPLSEGTAKHFCHHLDEFIEQEKLTHCTTGVIGEEMHHAAYCDAPEPHFDIIQRFLRPKRFTEEPQPPALHFCICNYCCRCAVV